MPVGFFKRYRDAWIPADDDARAEIRRQKESVAVRIEWHRSRSPDQHRLLFAMLNVALPMTDYTVMDDLLAAVKVKLGHYTQSMDGIPIPKSIAFDNMPQDDFNQFFDGACRLLAETLGVTPDSLRGEAADTVLPNYIRNGEIAP